MKELNYTTPAPSPFLSPLPPSLCENPLYFATLIYYYKLEVIAAKYVNIQSIRCLYYLCPYSVEALGLTKETYRHTEMGIIGQASL